MISLSRTGQTLLIAASSMCFAAFTSVIVVRRGLGGDWLAPQLPAWIWATLLLGPLASWLIRRGQPYLAATTALTLVATQIALLARLHAADIAQASAAVLIAAHAAHATAGAAALFKFGPRATLFWDFAGVLWIYVVFLIGVWA